MPEISGEVNVNCVCPKCGHKFMTVNEVTLDFDVGDYAPDHGWRD